MEMMIFAVGIAFFVFESVQWRKRYRNEPIAFPSLLYAIGLVLAWLSARHAPIPAPASFILPAFKPVIETVSSWLG
ncbi:hypothetical protein [Cohnella panacarvi]|uniref:hypothetical protein n=1 Tax=Cohnella panacarvi TaxID=400776 RepID=UPI00047BF308|nr:hypothetical protein [Cohnella panacarvi]